MKSRLLASVAAIGVLFMAGSPQAGQITFGPSTQSMTFTGNGANSVTVSSPTLTGQASDTTNGLVGSFTLSAMNFTAGPQVAGLFAIPANTETFTYTNPDGDTLTDTVHFTEIQDNTPQPKFFATAVTTSISGDGHSAPPSVMSGIPIASISLPTFSSATRHPTATPWISWRPRGLRRPPRYRVARMSMSVVPPSRNQQLSRCSARPCSASV
jgi:hypothetical protein